MASMTRDERRKAIAVHYAEKFQCPELLHPINYVEKNWCEDEYSGGCYVSTFPPGVLTQFGPEIRRPFQRVYIAGTESATYWAGYMEGAIQSGERAAREILNATGRIPTSEIWQEEPQLPEFPEPPFEPLFIEKLLPSVPIFIAFCGIIVGGLVAFLFTLHSAS
jgi:monoamine oxidase